MPLSFFAPKRGPSLGGAGKETMAKTKKPGIGETLESRESLSDLRAQIARVSNEVEKLSAIMEGLVSTRVAGASCRRLAAHPAERKRAVLDFLNYCWCDETEKGYFGLPLLTVDLEFHQFMVWRGSIKNQSRRKAAMEVSTLDEYIACREGARKAFPQIWRKIQKGRKEELG